MDMKMIFQNSKYIRYISFTLLVGYAIHPFINGLGCNYHAQSDDSKLNFYTTCKFGLIESVVKNKMTDKLVSFKGIYGKSGNTAFFLTYQIDILSSQKPIVKNITELYTSNRVFVSKVIKNSDGSDWVLLQHPYYTVHKSKHVGRVSIF